MDRTSLDMTPLWPPRNLFCSCVAGEVSWLQERTSSLNCPAILVLEFWSIENESPWRRKWQPTPVFLPGKFHGERSLVGYSSWGKKKKKKKKRENESPIALPWWGLNFLLPQIYQRCFICALHSHSSFIIYVGDWPILSVCNLNSAEQEAASLI